MIFFRDQHLDEDQQTTFGRQFGDLDAFPFGKPGKNPFTLEILRSPGTENGWHTDVTWMEQPSLGSIAQCVHTPPYGGDTLFADSHAAYLGLPSALRDRIDHLSGINDYRSGSNIRWCAPIRKLASQRRTCTAGSSATSQYSGASDLG